MKQRLLRYFAAHPLRLLSLFVGIFVIAPLSFIGAWAFRAASPAAPNTSAIAQDETAIKGALVPDKKKSSLNEDGAAIDPRKILGRGWFDSLPQKRTDVIKLYFFGGGGIGIYEEGSSFRYSVDVFELERNANKISMTFLHDKKTAQVTFTITSCDELPPFDLCLDLPNSPRGPKRYYGFDDNDDYATHFQWLRGTIESATRMTE